MSVPLISFPMVRTSPDVRRVGPLLRELERRPLGEPGLFLREFGQRRYHQLRTMKAARLSHLVARRRDRLAFTLIELLVVITIIAVLTALLMPALQSARERAQASVCTAHEKQAGAAFAAYLNDHQGYYPYIGPECMPQKDTSLAPCTCNTNLTGCAGSNGGINWDPSCPQAPCWPGGWQGSSCCITPNIWTVRLASYFGYPSLKSSANYARQMQCPLNPGRWGHR